MAYGGLRGGIAFSLCKLMCVQLVPAIQNMFCATIIAVFFTSFIQVRLIAHFIYFFNKNIDDDAQVQKIILFRHFEEN